MSTSTEGLAVPRWDLADRLGKALRVGNVSVQEMADYLEVHRNSVSAWINGRVTPSGQTIRLWALRTGVPYEWVRNGVDPSSPDGPGGGEMPVGNQEAQSAGLASRGSVTSIFPRLTPSQHVA